MARPSATRSKISSQTQNGAALSAAQKIKSIGVNARQVFIDREEVISAFECGLCSGEHIMLLGQPGTGKSALARYFSECMDLNFFRTVLNPDTVREDLFGPISAKALSEDRWERKWSALATADIALTDEIGKTSSQVQNMLLDAMEERKARSADIEIDLPLHLLVAGTNETLDDDAAAIWDRFTIRVIVKYLRNANDFSRLLDIDPGVRQIISVDRDELVLLRQTTHQMSICLSSEVKKMAVEMWSEISNVIDTPISDRRWKKWLKVAAGHALLANRQEISTADLIVGKWVLWDDIDDERKIYDWVSEKVNKDQQEYLDQTALVTELEAEIAKANLTRQAKMEILYRANRALRFLSKKDLADPKWKDLFERGNLVAEILSEEE